jgi:hypothetical protein
MWILLFPFLSPDFLNKVCYHQEAEIKLYNCNTPNSEVLEVPELPMTHNKDETGCHESPKNDSNDK